MSLNEYYHKITPTPPLPPPPKKKKNVQKGFQTQKTEMQMVLVKKTQFAALNDKKVYFS